MFYLWRRGESDSPCGIEYTVTVTETVLQDAATSTLVNLIDGTSTALSPIDTSSTALPNFGANAAMGPSGNSTFDSQPTVASSHTTISGSSSSSSNSTQEATVSVTSTLGTTKTLSLVSATPPIGASRPAPPRASECPSSDASHGSSSPPAATIAGSIVGSMAGLALVGLLVSYLLKRKRKWKAKLTIKKKTTTEENDSQRGEDAPQMGNVIATLEALERRSLASPRSFEFGFNPATAPLPALPKHSTAVRPPQWI
ncbi:uncharacterized protein A1O9_12141 [Exophiala aquamarina CBS 119918]|uniref:Mid2 domain-containing protein n=1 Tax=Exophiala aquamarina CBS 119918 TaxID=1182545 RepID=A0A072NVC5_9EURO|nr:uncharacterized protein A1O9_12141 [Exophiala aquamarina CBS 119918]KEF51804.1 hypothetical protein A1O9_12141 [Exophiala aquamarina CBS 119918]